MCNEFERLGSGVQTRWTGQDRVTARRVSLTAWKIGGAACKTGGAAVAVAGRGGVSEVQLGGPCLAPGGTSGGEGSVRRFLCLVAHRTRTQQGRLLRRAFRRRRAAKRASNVAFVSGCAPGTEGLCEGPPRRSAARDKNNGHGERKPGWELKDSILFSLIQQKRRSGGGGGGAERRGGELDGDPQDENLPLVEACVPSRSRGTQMEVFCELVQPL